LHLFNFIDYFYDVSPALRPLYNTLLCPISAEASLSCLRQAQILILEILPCIPAVKIIAFLELEQIWMFLKGLTLIGN